MNTEGSPGFIRLSVTTIAEVAARAAVHVEGVRDDFERLLKTVELFRGEDVLPHGEKVPLETQDLVVRLRITVSASAPSFFLVARRVQRSVFDALYSRLGIVPSRVHVEVQNVDWSDLDERG
jgi:uncharacterized alkaline shock family protein YloU